MPKKNAIEAATNKTDDSANSAASKTATLCDLWPGRRVSSRDEGLSGSSSDGRRP